MSRAAAAVRIDETAPARDERRASPGSAVNFELITARKDFDRLGPEWDALFVRAGLDHQVFQTFNWTWHWCNHYLSNTDNELSIVTARRDGRLIMVWPLITEHTAGLRILTWMGEPVSQYGDVVIDDIPDATDVLRAAWSFAKASAPADLVWLQRVREDARIAPLIRELGGTAFNERIAPYQIADAVADAEESTARARKKRRALAKRRNKLGESAFIHESDSDAARQAALQAIVWKSQQLRERGIVSTAIDHRFSAFFADATSGEHPCGCRTVLLTSDGAPIAGGIFVACKERMVAHVIGYTTGFEKASPGILLLEHTMLEALDDGFNCVDLLPPGDAYKARLTSASINVADWAIPLSLKGRAYAHGYLGVVRPGMKSAIALMPDIARKRLAQFFLDRKSD